ncbi:peptidoglycan-binding domain-containing protein [Caulobacter segnis]|uniref:peptidoglycan-binding domain-containing protein n=1 Tax=Caulobacter segnis TaxID=88688 RepID=UPI0002FA6E04|nr:peptidoglycan-binding domain-containing protein [Caulobacter segnis]
MIAGRAGDPTARSRANALRPQLTAEALQTADRSAQAFRAQAPVQTASLAPTNTGAAGDFGTAQQALSQLGYYQGPRDGVASPALRLAIAAYQRDQGLPASGEVDSQTLGRLAGSAR